MPKTIGVALSGGSALGIAHIGVLKALEENGIKIDCVAGTSAGAIIAACYAFGVPLEKVAEKARGLSWYTLSKFSFSTLGFISHAALGKLIHEFIGNVNIEDAEIPLAVIATDLATGERMAFKKGPLADALMASTCIPGVFIPIEIGGRLFVDGGLVDHLPLSALREMGATVKIGANVSRWISRQRPKNILDVLGRSLAIATDYRYAPEKDEIFIEPHLEAFTPSDFRKADDLVDEGYRAAELKIKEIRRLAGRKTPVAGFWTKAKSWLRTY
ncbi:MAG TPA: patatin-like phospholipase family protein [Candidatus Paceibacterota bacterium]|nr:patatin-like phospholipase family protein [Candidatus Paceibacterota bacterium]